MSAQGDFLAAVHATSEAAGRYAAHPVWEERRRIELRRSLARAREHEETCRAAYLAGETWEPVDSGGQPPVDVRERLWKAAETVMHSVAAGDTTPEAAVRALRDLLCSTNRWDWMAEWASQLFGDLNEDDLLEAALEEAMSDTGKARELVAWMASGGIKELVQEVTSLPVADADGFRWEVERWGRAAAVFTERKLAEDWARTCGGQLRRVEPRREPGVGYIGGGPRQVVHKGISIEPHPEHEGMAVVREGGDREVPGTTKVEATIAIEGAHIAGTVGSVWGRAAILLMGEEPGVKVVKWRDGRLSAVQQIELNDLANGSFTLRRLAVSLSSSEVTGITMEDDDVDET